VRLVEAIRQIGCDGRAGEGSDREQGGEQFLHSNTLRKIQLSTLVG
jgi:hypothetical protein